MAQSMHSGTRVDSHRKDSPRKARSRSRGKRRSRSRSRRRRDKKEDKHDKDKDTPHFSWKRGMELGPGSRYVVQRLLGDGTFGRVLSCLDKQTKEIVAVKVVKGVKRYCEHAMAEAEVLTEILRHDPGHQSLCVQLRCSFLHPPRHMCLVFEPLDINIRDFLKANDNRGLYAADVQQITEQILQSLSFLHAIGVTHTDLKCRNVMLRDGSYNIAPHPRVDGVQTRRPRNCQIAVIDFGGAVFPHERHSGRIGTRQFRAPEVVLGLEWDETSDLWSAGCIIGMLYLGQRPFSVHEDMEHLAMMERILDAKIPKRMAKEANVEGVTFEDNGCLAWPRKAPNEDAVERVMALKRLRDQVCSRHTSFYKLLQGLLSIDPKKRLVAAEGLRCSFLMHEAVTE